MLKMTRNDVFFILITFCLCIFLCAFVYLGQNGDGDSVEIFVRGTKISTHSLTKDAEIDLNPHGANLCIQIKNGYASVSSSACAGQNCVHTAPIHNAGQVILCAPQQVLLQIVSEFKPDAVVT